MRSLDSSNLKLTVSRVAWIDKSRPRICQSGRNGGMLPSVYQVTLSQTGPGGVMLRISSLPNGVPKQ